MVLDLLMMITLKTGCHQNVKRKMVCTFSGDSTHTGDNDFSTSDFPYGILIVVSIGVSLGVFCGGLLLSLAVMFMKR